jgi:hypothetical protein
MLPLTLLAEPVAPQRPVSLFDATRSYASTGANAGPAMRTLGADPPAFSPQPSPPLTDSDDDLDGLPVRVRQASIAPQLRKPHTRNERDVTSRSPEELHDLMSTMQQGWRQGRKECEGNGDARNGRDPHGRPEI